MIVLLVMFLMFICLLVFDKKNKMEMDKIKERVSKLEKENETDLLDDDISKIIDEVNEK